MSSKQGRSCIDPLVQSNMEGAVGTVVPVELPKADSLPNYSHDKALPISRAYFPYSLGGQDTIDFPSPWGPSKTCVRNGPSPGIHSSATQGSITIPAVYRPDKASFPVDAGGGRCAVPQELVAKQRLAYYANSPRQHSPRPAGVISPVAVPKAHIGGSNAERCVGLAIPKPVYSHSPCCTERGCTAGHNYGMEHRPHRMSPRIYDEEWAAHFSRLAYLHKKGQEALTQQRVLQFENGVEAIKDGKTEGYHGIGSNGPRRSLPLMEPSYTYNTARPFIGATPEYCQRAPIHAQMHTGLHYAYDPRTIAQRGVPTKVYQNHPHMSKYTSMPPCPNVYYPQSHPEAYRTDPKVITDEHGQHHHMDQFHSPRADLMSPSCSVAPPHHPLISKYPTYHPYGVHLNRNQALMHEQPHPPFPVHQSERPLDFSIRRVQTTDSPRELYRQSGTSGAFHPTPAHYRRLSNTTTLEHSEMSETGFLVGSSKEFPVKSSEEVSKNRHHVSDSPDKDVLAKRHREELEMDMASKKQKINSTHELSDDEPRSPFSPPMPVINKVFSLAPYKVYFEATGMLSSLGDSKSPKPQPEATQLKQEPEIENCDLEPNSGEGDLRLKQEAKMSPANNDGPVEMPDTEKIKKEKLDPDDVAYQSEMKASITEEMNHQAHDSVVKEEQRESDTSMSGSLTCHVVVKNDFEEESNPPFRENSESSTTCKTENAVKGDMDSISFPTLPSTPPVPCPSTKFSLSKIPPHCLKLSNFKIIIPPVLKAPAATQPVEFSQSPVEDKPVMSSSKQARHQFMELHQSLCRLIYCCVTRTPCQELRDWLCKLDLQESGKAQKVSCLLGLKMRELWLKDKEMEVSLQKVVCQLQKYVESRECPFPHVMRAGAVFIPMLVVKEVLFPQVQGTFIDQVLQEHRVELRPTTLSEERQLTQLHRKAFSSKLRRLLSLKHLPDIYPDVLNLLYHVNVCKFLGAETSLTFKRESTDSSDESTSFVNGAEGFYQESSRPLTPETTRVDKYYLKKKKGRVKISSKRTFLDETSSSQEDEFTEEPARWNVVSSLEKDEWDASLVTCNDRGGPHVEVKIEDGTQDEPENSWARPLTSDDLSSDSTDEETESTSSVSFQSARSSSAGSARGLSKGPSSMVLKLRKVFYNGGPHYQVTDSSEAPEDFRHTDSDHYRKNKHKSSQRNRCHADKDFSFRSYSQNHPYLTQKHGSKHRRRWVLRSAVQSARLVMENRYPELVGKRIWHLYEENDKTEVWYRGVVLRIHEPHTNPLKTVFEVKYDSEPEWQYYLELLVDYKKGWLKVED